MKSEIRVLKMLVPTMIPSRFFMGIIKNHLICIGKHNVSRARFPLLTFLGFPIGKLDILRSGDHAMKTLCFLIEKK